MQRLKFYVLYLKKFKKQKKILRKAFYSKFTIIHKILSKKHASVLIMQQM